MFDRERILFILLAGFFICNAIVAEMIGGKIFSVEAILGLEPMNLKLFGGEGYAFDMTAGVLLWPFVFIMTDIINEYYGVRGVRLLSWLAAGLISYAFIMIACAMWLPASGFWVEKELADGTVVNMDTAFDVIFGQGLWIIIGSIVAFLLGQLIDAYVFRRLKRMTGNKMIWLRATGSTAISQMVDSFVVIFIAFYIGAGWPIGKVFAIALVGYLYKFVAAVLITPLLYVAHAAIDRFLGKEVALRMSTEAAKSN